MVIIFWPFFPDNIVGLLDLRENNIRKSLNKIFSFRNFPTSFLCHFLMFWTRIPYKKLRLSLTRLNLNKTKLFSEVKPKIFVMVEWVIICVHLNEKRSQKSRVFLIVTKWISFPRYLWIFTYSSDLFRRIEKYFWKLLSIRWMH